MSIFDLLSLAGGLAMFLYGMRLMGDSLKESSSATLKNAMERVTNNPVKAFILGFLVTALIQSSTATIVITSGLVGAGILSLHQSLGIIVGANVGTTVTGQIIRLLDLDVEGGGGASWLRFFQPSTLAPIALILGMVIIMSGTLKNSKSLGNIAVGFGILFTGLLQMTGAVGDLAESGIVENIFASLGSNPFLGYLAGAGIAFILQSSSATIGILQAFSATGLLFFKGVYAVIVGVYLGDCVTTAIVCSIGAKPDAKRVGIINIVFNLCKTILVLVGVNLAHQLGFLDALWDKPVNSSIIANTNTVFNLVCALILLPMMSSYEKLSHSLVKDEALPEEASKYKEKLDALSPVFFPTPALALSSCYDVLLAMFTGARENLEISFSLLKGYDPKQMEVLKREEDNIDHMTDKLSQYMVELLPHLHTEMHVGILNQYYRVTAEFERLGDQAVFIGQQAESLSSNNTHFSQTAEKELGVLIQLTNELLNLTEESFKKRDMDAAQKIEPLVQVAGEMVSQLKNNHFQRMGNGTCSLLADACFSNLLNYFKRIADICSNIGIATIVRVRPDLADHEHTYFERLHSGSNEMFNQSYQESRNRFIALLETK